MTNRLLEYLLTPSTEEQKAAIMHDGGSVLLSASAGSGKTHVLTMRVLRKMLVGENPVSPKKLLIVTFTNAAALEMRGRIEKKLAELARKFPGNTAVSEALGEISSASICTIDSFCGKLLREHFNILGLSPNFRIAAENEISEIKANVLSALLEKLYVEKNESFSSLLEFFGEKDDKIVSEIIEKLYEKSRCNPNPIEWLDEKKHCLHDIAEHKTRVLKHAAAVLKKAEQLAAQSLEIVENVEAVKETYLAESVTRLSEIQEMLTLAESKDFNRLSQLELSPFKWNRGKNVPERKAAAAFSNAAKDLVADVKTNFINCSEEEIKTDIAETSPHSDTLYNITKSFYEAVEAEKIRRNVVDFSDLRLYTVKLLSDQTIAAELRESFDEILIDEFQDNNRLQYSIFKTLSKDESNLFIIGDVKQSIYGFQNAAPDIFIEQKSNPKITEIILNKNFRSRRQVIDFTNNVMSRLMENSAIDYESEKLIPCASYVNDNSFTAEIVNVDPGNDDKIEVQARFVAEKIKEYKQKGYGYRDFAVIYRSGDSRAAAFAKVFAEHSIPYQKSKSDGYFDSPEVVNMLALLRVIDNPRRDIDLSTVMLSPVGGFSPDFMLALKQNAENKHASVFTLLQKDESENTKKFFSLLSELRSFAAQSSPEDLITYIYEQVMFYEKNKTNLRKLTSLAREYKEAAGDLSGFVRRLDAVIKSGGRFDIDNVITKNADTVQIITIHKSKGLEYPFVFFVGTETEFNYRDLYQKYIISSKYGLALKVLRPSLLQVFEPLTFASVKLYEKSKLYEENLRLLYVALTRAKEKLFVISGIPEDKLPENGDVPTDGNSFAKLMLSFVPYTTISLTENQTESTTEQTAATDQTAVNAIADKLRANLSYEYPFITNAPRKMSVTALSHSDSDFTHFENEFTNNEKTATKGTGGGKSSGTATHEFLQFADIKKAKADLEEEISRLIDEKYITPENGALINKTELSAFLESPLIARVLSADKVYKEYEFLDKITLPEYGEEEIYLQGIADLVIVENGQATIIDYKTDRVSVSDTLKERYGKQLRLYKIAIEKALALTVKECLIYSLCLSAEIIL
jgi:ATP-dependent exoDNAse (exonuclease V) beta subunit (contains helicase and exonuclease domains)